MVGSEIELGPSDSRWLTTNILIHDLCHDFNVSTMKQRMSKLNSSFKSFSEKFPMLTGGALSMYNKRTVEEVLGIAGGPLPPPPKKTKLPPTPPQQSFVSTVVQELALWRLQMMKENPPLEEETSPLEKENSPLEKENSPLEKENSPLEKFKSETTSLPKNKKITLFVFFKFIEEIQEKFLENKNTNLISSIINFDNNILIKDVLNYHFKLEMDKSDLDDYILDEYILDDIEKEFFKDAKYFYGPYYENIISTLKIFKKSYAFDPYEENNSIKYSFFLLMLLTGSEKTRDQVDIMINKNTDMDKKLPESISFFLYFIKELDHYIDYIKLYFISHIDLEKKPLFEENQLNEIIKIGSHILTSLYDDNYANAGTTYDFNKIFDKLKIEPSRRIEVPRQGKRNNPDGTDSRPAKALRKNGGAATATTEKKYKTLLGKIKKFNIEEYAANCNAIIDGLLPKKKKLIDKRLPWREEEACDKHMSAILKKIGFNEDGVVDALSRKPLSLYYLLLRVRGLEFIPFFYDHILDDDRDFLESDEGKEVLKDIREALEDIRHIKIIRVREAKIWNAIINYKNVLDESFKKLETFQAIRHDNLDKFNTRTYRTIRMLVKNSLDDILKYMKMFLTSLRIQLEKKIPKQPREPNGGPLDVTAVPIVNNLLTVITKRVLEITDGGYSEDVNPEKKKFFNKSRKILNNIAETGRVPTTHDKNLLDAFKNFERPTSPTTPNEILEIFTNYHKFINNSMGTKDPEDPGKKIVKNHDGQKLCLLPSLLDAQGTFGSCTSKDYKNAEHDILLKAGNEEEGYLFEFNFNIKGTQNGKCIANYYLIYNNPYGGINSDDTDAGEGLTLYNCNITTNLGPDSSKQDKNIISANNTLKLLLNHIELVFYQQPNPPTWKIFENTEYLVELLKKSSRKMIGDFGQELVSIADDAGFVEVDDYEEVMNHKDYSIILANGDRPSAVRAAFIMKNAKNRLKHKRGILYGADKLLHLWEHNTHTHNSTGGNLKNKKQIITHKKLKTKKHSKKKNKQKINTRKKIKKTKKYKKKTKNKK
jgi:hypothetical protein